MPSQVINFQVCALITAVDTAGFDDDEGLTEYAMQSSRGTFSGLVCTMLFGL